jgi:hypothetical protein
MTELGLNHCRIVGGCLNGKAEISEQIFASMAVLAERLGKLKSLGGIISKVEFSPYIKKIKSRENTVTVG